MHDVQMAEVTQDFARCWQAAGLHIERQAGGELSSWLRAHLTPPFLEHLSFRLGNQLFFIQLVDIDGQLETPGNPEGLLRVADGCNGYACLMPMQLRGLDWKPVELGWGLIDARTHEQIDPVSLISDEDIEMTDWELQDFAVQVVRDRLDFEGRELMSWNGDPGVNPSLWFVGDDGPEWVIARAARYPLKDAPLPENIEELKEHFSGMGCPGHFASVGVVSMDDPIDPDAQHNGNWIPLYRGHGMHVRYEGLRSI